MSKTTKGIHRFSNEYIFKEREIDKGLLSMKNKNKSSINFFLKKKKEEKRNCAASSFLSTSTTFLLKEISDISIRQNLWNKIFNEPKPINEEIKEDKIKNNFYSINKSKIRLNNNMYLTGINSSKSFISYNKNNDDFIKTFQKTKKNLIRKERNVENLMNNTYTKSFALFNTCKNNNNMNILKYFEEQKNNIDKNNYIKKEMNKTFTLNKIKERKKIDLLNIKTKNINLRKDSLFEHMNKLRKFTILKNETKMNDDKKSNLIDSYQNNLYYYNSKYQDLHKNMILLKKKFYGKLAEYMKFINAKIDEEKNRNANLIYKKITLREKVKQLNNKLIEKEYQKNNIIRWIYFQIQVKEKLLSIPSYYKDIIENKTQKIEKKEEKPNKVMRMSVKPNIKVSSKKLNLTGFNPRKTFKVKRLLNQSQKDINSLKEFVKISERYKEATDDEMKKVYNYLKYPIFKNVKELLDNLELYQNEIMLKSKDYYELRFQIFSERNILLKYQDEANKNKINYEKGLKIRNRLLEQVKEINNVHNDEKKGVKYYNKNDKKLEIFYKDLNKKINLNENPLIYKINLIYENCKILNLEINLDIKSFGKENGSTPLIIEILYKLKYITQVTNIILSEFKFYREHDKEKSELIKRLKYEIDKHHKAAKSIEQKNKEKERSLKLLNRIEEKNNKILFLPKKKVVKNNSFTKINRIKKSTVEEETSFLDF